MKYFNHNKLHELMDSDKELKKMSDRIHEEPALQSFQELLESKQNMIEVYTKAVGCDCFKEAKIHLKKVIILLEKHYQTWKNWKKGIKNSDFSKELGILKEEFKSQKKCCSAGGNDYMCFCDEK